MAYFTPRSIETLIDLVEIKLSCLDVMDREDREELKVLQRALTELTAYLTVECPPRRVARRAGHERAAA